jgi:uncharacterized repeat protein (TIGR03803 family)
MHTTKITRTLALAGFAPAGKLSHLYRGLLPVLALLVATLGKLNWRKRAYTVLVLCAATAIALPAQTYTTLHTFDGTDGGNPGPGLVQATNGDLYGTTRDGGTNDFCTNYNQVQVGCGTIFKITPNGTLTTLYNFCAQSGCTDGAYPGARLVQVADGDFYGTTIGGGANNNPNVCNDYPFSSAAGCGTIFKITPSGTLTTLYSFCAQSGCTDGANPLAGLVEAANGDLYGTASSSGTFYGTVFKITPSGALTTLYSFCAQSGCTDGAGPYAGLVQATNGDFYGTTYGGGANNGGTVFKITPSGTLTTLYSFCSQGGDLCTDGNGPLAGLVQDTNRDLYGTTSSGGANCAPTLGCGTVFKITPDGALTTIHSFAVTDGEYPAAALIQGTDGELYGTTEFGGAYGFGTLFKITPSGTLTTLYTFCSQDYPICTDGGYPQGVLVQDTNGTLYGTTAIGGTSNDGVVFSLSVGLGPFVETQRSYGTVGAVIKILGTDLAGATSVSFNGTAAAFTVVSPSLIAATVPAGATSGKVQVVTPSRTLSSNVPFRVLP